MAVVLVMQGQLQEQDDDLGRQRGSETLHQAHQGSDREEPVIGYRTVAHLLGLNKNTVQLIFQLKGWQVRKRPVGFIASIQAIAFNGAKAMDERWANLCRVWVGPLWLGLAGLGELLQSEDAGLAPYRIGRFKAAETALKQAPLARCGCLGKGRHPFLL